MGYFIIFHQVSGIILVIFRFISKIFKDEQELDAICADCCFMHKPEYAVCR